MKVLVYGAGNIGSLYAARLSESREDVSILARGERLARIRFRALVKGTSVATPAMDHLYTYVDPSAEPITDGSSELSVRWGRVWGLVAAAVLVSMLGWVML